MHYIPFSFCESPRNDIIACRRRSRCLRWSFRFILSTFVGHFEGFWFYIPKRSEKLKLKTIFQVTAKFTWVLFSGYYNKTCRFHGNLATNMADSTRWSQLLWRLCFLALAPVSLQQKVSVGMFPYASVACRDPRDLHPDDCMQRGSKKFQPSNK